MYIHSRSHVIDLCTNARFMQKATGGSKATAASQFRMRLILDENTGELWTVPLSSRLSSLNEPLIVTQDVFQRIQYARQDADAFVNAEQLWLACEMTKNVVTSMWRTQGNDVIFVTEVGFPSHRFDRCPTMIFALNYFHQVAAARVHVSALRPLRSEKPSELRPPPSVFLGATRVKNLMDLRPVDRELYLSIPVAGFFFRDCSADLEEHWNSTRYMKENCPQRSLFQKRVQVALAASRKEEIERLFDKTNDSNAAERVALNAKRGIRLLDTLYNTHNVCKTTRASWLGSLPQDLKTVIMTHAITSILRDPDSTQAAKAFATIRMVSWEFNDLSTTLIRKQLHEAASAVAQFVYNGIPLVPHQSLTFCSWTYKETACPPGILLSASRKGWILDIEQHYFSSRVRGGLLPSVCLARQLFWSTKTKAVPPRITHLKRLLDGNV